MSKTVRPFHAGSQYADWAARNCWECALWDRGAYQAPSCAIDQAIGDALLNYGDVPRKIAKRMGYFGNELAYTWDCPEKQ